MKTGRRFWQAGLTVAVGAGMILSAAGGPAPKKWNLGLTLQTAGRYQVVSRGVTYQGDFAFTLTWEGTMEEDGDDFRLVQREVALPEWEAYEVSSATSSASLLTTQDFPDKPAFQYVYVLKEGPFFQIVFGLEDFAIPACSSSEKINLDLPRAAGSNVPPSPVDYKAHIKKGSNALRFSSDLITNRPVEKTFAWAWGHQRWLPAGDQICYCLSNHQVKAKVVVQPQTEPPGRPVSKFSLNP